MNHEREPKLESSESSKAELEALGNERLRELSEKSPEKSADNQSERLENAREQLQRQEVAPEPTNTTEKDNSRHHLITKLDRALNYTHTMQSVQRRLSPASRRFSKLIHTPAVEKTSEVLEQTIMRPSVTLGATLTALIIGFSFYITAKTYGFRLSGSEMLFSLIVGGLLGAGTELLFKTLRKR